MKHGEFDVCIATYEALRYVPEVYKKYKWHLVVFDEAHKLKNDGTQVHERAMKLKC
jgi:SNF2 family DNA or RNA helicase